MTCLDTLFYVLWGSKPGFVLNLFLNFLPKSRLLFLYYCSCKKKSVIQFGSERQSQHLTKAISHQGQTHPFYINRPELLEWLHGANWIFRALKLTSHFIAQSNRLNQFAYFSCTTGANKMDINIVFEGGFIKLDFTYLNTI